MHISLRQPKFSTSRFAEANNIEYKIVDGNNIIEVFESSKYLIEKIREGDGPKFLEAVTHRHYGHVDWRKDVDVGVNRSEQDLNDWNDRDPISRLEKTLLKNFKNFKLKNISNLEKKIDQEINNAWEKALKDPYPKKSELLKRVYFKP
jgi:pyruvate dehydrogenase E1 component alpha subunit